KHEQAQDAENRAADLTPVDLRFLERALQTHGQEADRHSEEKVIGPGNVSGNRKLCEQWHVTHECDDRDCESNPNQNVAATLHRRSITASVTCCVEAEPPRSAGLKRPSASTAATARSTACPACSRPRWSSIMPADRIAASGFTT